MFALFEMTREDLVECKPVTFANLEIKEREGLQHVLRDHIEVLGNDLLVIEAVSKLLPPSRLRVIPGQFQDPAAVEEALREHGVNELERYFTDAPFSEDGKTYGLTKMWGRRTEPTLSALRDAFRAAEVSFRAEN